nr:arginine--tRNA ligase, chloroplastic/mitochondrial-like isoform X2 [Tanacetum cinerariifolium]
MELILVNIRLPEDKRWSFQQEIRKIIEASLNSSFPDLKEKQRPLICDSPEEELGDFICQNVLEISPKFRKSPELKEMYPHIQGPRDIGEAIKKNLLKSASDIIKGPSVLDVGFVTFSLSREWMAQSIHKMLKDGIDTWAPKLPVERVYVDYPSLHEEIHVGSRKLPFILSKRDFNNSFIDLEGLRYVNEEKKPEWIIYVTPVRQQEYIEMCLTAAKHEKWIQTDKEGKWNPSCKNEYPVSTSAGYRSSSTKQEELFNLLDKVDTRCDVVAEGMAAKLLGYSAQEVIDCVLTYTLLKNHRLADCTFNFDEMVNEEGNTFVYLLNTLAEIYTIIANSRKDIDELKKASEIDEGLGGGEERVLEFHLLEFTEASCIS